MTYYFDSRDKPPVGPDDDEREGGGDPDGRRPSAPAASRR